MTNRLTRSEREQIIFQHLKGTPNPLYSVQETKHGRYIVKPKTIASLVEHNDEQVEQSNVKPNVKSNAKPKAKPKVKQVVEDDDEYEEDDFEQDEEEDVEQQVEEQVN